MELAGKEPLQLLSDTSAVCARPPEEASVYQKLLWFFMCDDVSMLREGRESYRSREQFDIVFDEDRRVNLELHSDKSRGWVDWQTGYHVFTKMREFKTGGRRFLN